MKRNAIVTTFAALGLVLANTASAAGESQQKSEMGQQQTTLERQFSHLDQNNDGALDREESDRAQDLQTTFEQADSDDNGRLSLKEFQNAMSERERERMAQSQSPSESDVDATKVKVKQQGAEIAVAQQPPKVLVRQPEPRVRIKQPEPKIQVQQAEPEVTVKQAQAQVSVEKMGEPRVNVQKAEPKVNIDDAPAEVTVEQKGEPEIRVVQAQDDPKGDHTQHSRTKDGEHAAAQMGDPRGQDSAAQAKQDQAQAKQEQVRAKEQTRASFEQLDANGDGHISRLEARQNTELSRQWTQADRNDDAQLDLAEFSAFESSGADSERQQDMKSPDVKQQEPQKHGSQQQ